MEITNINNHNFIQSKNNLVSTNYMTDFTVYKWYSVYHCTICNIHVLINIDVPVKKPKYVVEKLNKNISNDPDFDEFWLETDNLNIIDNCDEILIREIIS